MSRARGREGGSEAHGRGRLDLCACVVIVDRHVARIVQESESERETGELRGVGLRDS